MRGIEGNRVITRNGVHGWVWVRFFQEHEYARIDTNIRLMGIEGNREITRRIVTLIFCPQSPKKSHF